MDRKRLAYMDMAKGVGILCVVLVHSTTLPEGITACLAKPAMPLFFVVSGMLIACTGEEEKDGKELLRKKAATLLVPFFWFTCLYILRDLVNLCFGIGDLAAVEMDVMAFVTLYGCSVLWFLSTLFFSEIAFVFLRKRYSVPRTFLICLILTVASFLINGVLTEHEALMEASRVFRYPAYFIRSFLRAAYALPFLCAGYYMFVRFRNFWGEEGKFSPGQSVAGALLIGLGIFGNRFQTSYDFRTLSMGENPVFTYLSAFVYVLGILFLCKNCRPIKPLIYFGKNSLIVMATHLDLNVLYAALSLAYRINRFIPRFNRVFFFVNVMGTVLLLEVVCIAVVNRYLPFLIGKKRAGRR